MHSLIENLNKNYLKKKVTDVRSGDTVRVSQKIQEGGKQRIQVFEGLVIATKNSKSLTSTITVRRIASGVGVEKTFLLHSPQIQKIDVVKRSKVRRNKLNYMKVRSGKSARLSSMAFDKDAINAEQLVNDEPKDEVVVGKTEVENTDDKDSSEEKPAKEDVAENTEKTEEIVEEEIAKDKKEDVDTDKSEDESAATDKKK